MFPVSEVRVKCAPWYCVMADSRSQSLTIRESATSLVEDSRVLYQSRDKAAAEKQCIALSLSTGMLYVRPCASPAVDRRGRAVGDPAKLDERLPTIKATIRRPYAWERI